MKTYVKYAIDNDDFTFYHSTTKVLQKVFPEISSNQLVLLKDFDERVVVFKGNVTANTLDPFLSQHTFPIVSPLTSKVMDLVFKYHAKSLIVFLREATRHETPRQDKEFTKVATLLRSPDYIFVISDIQESKGKDLADFWGLGEADLPVVEILDTRREPTRYRHSGSITADALGRFVLAWRNGTAPRFLKSESEPQSGSNQGPVFKVVGKTFEREVLNNDNDVLVNFYLPWCPHSQKLAPVYNSLATALSHNPKLRFYEIDVSQNDLPAQQISGVPTIKLFLGKNKANVVIFDGDMLEDELTRFLLEKCSHPITVTASDPNLELEDPIDDL